MRLKADTFPSLPETSGLGYFEARSELECTRSCTFSGANEQNSH